MGFTCSMVVTDGRGICSPVIGLRMCNSDISSAVTSHPLEDPIRYLLRMGGSGRVSL
uniref:Uncharacterized protein n=1 Tax=Arundo donax TaxID=35708 RepID=A0A0A9FDT9_ARUDO